MSHHKPQPPHRHVALWVATGVTLLLVIVLWAMILPTQLREGSGRSLTSWFRPLESSNAQTPQSLQDLMAASRRDLDVLEGQLRAKNVQENTVQSETDRLRARIEGAAAASETTNANSATTNTNTATTTNASVPKKH